MLRLAGIPVALAGLGLAVWAGRTLGSSLTPYPRPRRDGELVTGGPYRLARHPIYGGGLLLFLGYGLLASVPATAGALVLGGLWWAKSGVEERHLAARFDGYAEYRRRVRGRLLPLL